MRLQEKTRRGRWSLLGATCPETTADAYSVLMTREYRLLFHVKGLMANGYGKKEIASKAGIHPFAAGRYMDAAKRYELGELRTVMEEGAQLEQNVKTGLMTDTLAVELFIVKNSGKQ